MIQALLLSLRLHARWWLKAFGRDGRQLAPLRPYRLVLLLIGFPLFVLWQAWHWIGFLVDEILFRAYHRQPVKEPLFITGIPRSGTTFLHRTLARDQTAFTTIRTWEAVLAPSIFQKRLLRGLSRLDRCVGRPLHRCLDALTRRLTNRMDSIHTVDLHDPEEDYLTLLPAAGCFIMVLAFPASLSLWQLGRFPEVPDEQREILIRFYRRCLQKHLYDAPPGRRLLSKNAAFAYWLPDLRQAFPDARYIICVREPRSALTSQLSSLRPGLEGFGTLAAADTVSRGMQTVLAHAYRILLEEKESFLIDHFAVIDQAEMKTKGPRLIPEILRQLSIPISPELADAIETATRQSLNQPSPHRHAPLQASTGPAEFGPLVTRIYEDILRQPFVTRK
jgi:hypothetical protein